MVTMTKSFSVWCFTYHKELYSLLMFGHVELLTRELWEEYIEWCKTDEGMQYLDGQEDEHGLD